MKKIIMIIVIILFISCGYAEEYVDKEITVVINGYEYTEEEIYPSIVNYKDEYYIRYDNNTFGLLGYKLEGNVIVDNGLYRAYDYEAVKELNKDNIVESVANVIFENTEIKVEELLINGYVYFHMTGSFLESLDYKFSYQNDEIILNKKREYPFKYNYSKVIDDIDDYINRNFKKILNENDIVYGPGYEYIYGYDEVGKEFIYLKYDQGYSYIGNRENEEFNGLGRIEYDDGSGYIGEFVNSEFHGIGQYRYSYDDYLPISFYENGKMDMEENYIEPYVGLGESQDALVILVEFEDQKLTYDEEDWEDYFFSGKDNIAYNMQKLTDKKLSISPGKENNGIDNDGILKVTMPFNHPDTKDLLSNEMARIVGEVIKTQDDYVDFSQYDKNNDGIVSTFELKIISVIAGYEYNKSFEKGPSIYAHKNSFYSYPVRMDDVNIQGFLTVGEKDIRDKMISKGIVLHELFHLDGLLDLYDRDYSSSGLGIHSLMASGALISDQHGNYYYTALDPWSKYKLGVVSPQLISEVGTYRLYDERDSNYNLLKIQVNENEYLLLENRKFIGANKILSQFLRDSGVAVYKVNDQVVDENFIHNSLNDDENMQGIELIEANRLKIGYSQLKKGVNITTSNHYFNDENNSLNTIDFIGAGYENFTITFKENESYYEIIVKKN